MPLLKYEKDVLVIIDGYNYENEKAIPLNSFVFVNKTNTPVWQPNNIYFEDFLFRKSFEINPFCFCLHSKTDPQLHFVMHRKDGKLVAKQIGVDPSRASKNTYEEMNIFPGRLS